MKLQLLLITTLALVPLSLFAQVQNVAKDRDKNTEQGAMVSWKTLRLGGYYDVPYVIATSDGTTPISGGGGSSGTVAQGSTTAGQSGMLDQGAVTTAAPTYTTGQTSPLSLTTAGALRIFDTSLPALVDTNSGNKSASTLRVVLATDQPQLTNKLLVTPDSVALPANQSVNVAQVAGTNTVTGGVAGIMAVGGNVANAVTATANPVPVGGVFVTTPATLTTGQTGTLQFTAAQNIKTDQTTIAGTALDVNSGNKSAGTQRVVLATDQPNLTTPLNANVAQINGVTTLMGSGATGTGSQRVTMVTPATIATGQVTASGSAATLVAANANRASLTVYNEDATNAVFVGPATVTSANGAKIPALSSRVFRGATLLQVIAPAGSPVVDYVDETY